MSGRIEKFEDGKSGQEVAKQNGQAGPSRFHVDYWKRRLYRKTFTRDGQRSEVQEWSVRLQHLGCREAFALGTANAAAAAAKAKEIATLLDANGWEPTLARYKPGTAAKAEICSVGEFLAGVETRGHLRPRTFKIYAMKLRRIVADVVKLDAGLSRKAKRAKFDYVNGGHKAWLARVEGQRLDVLTPEAIAAWRNEFVARAGSDPLKRKSAERTAASCIRCARALFSPEIIGLLSVKVPPNPFSGVKLRDPGPKRYHSNVNPEWLILCAEKELREAEPQQFLALSLCLWAGLRRKEADLLAWAQVDLAEGSIHVRRTAFFEPKTEESQRVIDLAPAAVDVLRPFKDGSNSEFVLDGGDPDPTATWPYYRCNATWRKLIAWLQGKGVSERNAIHTLRKESGSLIACSYGIEAARQHLGHRDIRTTSAHYVDKKKRIEVRFPIRTGGQLQAV
ncbi:MAG: tyrosine-type recombinase/integrase [Opitutaceae bacterium]